MGRKDQDKQLVKLSAFRRDYFPADQKPCLPTLRKWFHNGDLPGNQIGTMIFIDVAKFNKTTGDALVDAVLAG